MASSMHFYSNKTLFNLKKRYAQLVKQNILVIGVAFPLLNEFHLLQ